VRLLLDTHAVVWLLTDDDRISETAVDHFADETNEVLLSAAVVLEIAIKRSLGKLDVQADIVGRLREAGVRPLSVTVEHAARVEHLPPHHRDPFDRLLVAQAMVEGAALLSRDAGLAAYDVPVLW
jgi:PIN domain nuclease of toxin-antitoxin system